MDLLILIVIAVFIITAVFVGYHASQESREKMAASHSIDISSFSNHMKQTTYALSIIADSSKF